MGDLVDYFVLVESTHTFVGTEKPLFYAENKELFQRYSEKIVHAMNAFLTKKNGEYDIIHEGYQLAIQKKTGI